MRLSACILVLIGCMTGLNLRAEAEDGVAFRWAASVNVAESPASLPAEEETGATRVLEVIGTGTIYRGNVAEARDNAIQDALRSAVERAVGLVLAPASVVQDFQLLSDRVYDQTQLFIDDYTVLTESKSGRHYRVLVRATASIRAVQERLRSTGILETNKGMPKVAFFLTEQNVGALGPEYLWRKGSGGNDMSPTESAFSKTMREKGFVIVSRPDLNSDTASGWEPGASELTDEEAAKLGHAMGADFAIVGSAVARYSGNIRDEYMKSIEALVSARAVETESGTVTASSEATRTVVHFDQQAGGQEALVLSASEAAQGLAREMEAKWRKEAGQAVVVELTVKGIQEYADFVKFRQKLKDNVPGVKNVSLRSIRAGEATMDVDIVGNARILADELMLQRFENLAVNIFEVSEKSVKLELIPSGGPGT